MVCNVDGNLHLDSRDWSTYSSILKFVGGVQFWVRRTISGHKKLISYQQTRFPSVNVRIDDLFPREKAEFYGIISLKLDQLFT